MENVSIEDFEECKRVFTSIFFQKHSPSNPNTPISIPKMPENCCYKRWKQSDKVFDGVYGSSGCSTPKTPATIDYKLKNPQFTILPSQYDRKSYIRSDSISSWRKSSIERVSFIEDPDMMNYSPPLSHKNSIVDFIEDSPGRYEHDFVQLEVLGSGEFGTVLKCLNKLDGFYYAIKRIKITAKSVRNEALQEAYILASSSMIDDNCYVIRYYSVWTESNYLYICMELCESSLKKYVEANVVTEVFINKLVRDIAKGLKKIHENSIVHMDIKPENILLSAYGKFKLADLGLGRITTNLTNEIPEGDCRYLASEVLESVSERQLPDLTKSDIFSFGATLYELISGTPLPRNGQGWQDIRNGNIEMPYGFSYKIRNCIKQMLSRAPNERPSAREILEKYFVSDKQTQIMKWKNYANWLEQKSEKKEEKTVKKRKLSI